MSPDDFKYYIDELAKSTGGTCGGLAVSVDKGGLKSAVVFEDVRELNMSLVQAERVAERAIRQLEPSGNDLGL